MEGNIFLKLRSSHLPEVLSPMEEKKYLERLNNGDEDAKEILIERNLRLVAKIANKFNRDDIDELFSEGVIGLIKAVKSYRMDKNVKLSTYASKCIENEILMYLRKNNYYKYSISIDEQVSTDENKPLYVENLLGEDDLNLNNLEYQSDIKKIFQFVKIDKDKEIISMLFGLNGKEKLTQKQIAKITGCSQCYISRQQKNIFKKLREAVLKGKIKLNYYSM